MLKSQQLMGDTVIGRRGRIEGPAASPQRGSGLIRRAAAIVAIGALAGGLGAGCVAAPASYPVGTSTQTITSGGVARTFQLTLPRSATTAAKGSIKLVIGLHGGYGSGASFNTITKFGDLANQKGFVFAAPDGLALKSVTGSTIRTWNAGRCCGPSVRDNIDDVGFVASVVSAIRAKVPAIGSVAIVGHSNGAMLTWRIACERPSLARSYVAVAGSFEGTHGCTVNSAARLYAIHGTADQNHPIGGGLGTRSTSGVSYRSMATSLSTWNSASGCTAAPSRAVSGALTTQTWTGCRSHGLTKYTTITGADHPWPGSAPLAPSLQGYPTTAMNATTTAWSFINI